MKPYPRNNINYDIVTPTYEKSVVNVTSRYSVYRQITNLPFKALEIKLSNSISKNTTYQGYYYTTTQNETLYQISKKFYNTENYWWIISKANSLKDDDISIIPPGVTLSIPVFIELTKTGGYFAQG